MRRPTLIVSLLALAAAAAPAFAQNTTPPETATATADDLDIVVTAQKREESLQDVPVAISVITGNALEARGGVNIENAQYLVPALTVRKSGTSINQSIFLRGVGTATFSIAGEPSVSTVVDGVVYSRSGEAFSDLVDIERIEVLRGPQGTLFGKNTSAGVISIVSRRPGSEFGGYVEGGFFFDNGQEYRVRGAVDLPFSDRAALRVTGFYSEYDGNIFNDAPNVNRRVNGYERYGVRGILVGDLSDAVRVTVIADWRKANDDCCGEVIAAPARQADGSVYQTFLDRAAVALPPLRGDKTRRLRQNLVTRTEEESYGASIQIDAELGTQTVTSITSYRKYDNREIRDGDFLDRPYVGIAQSHDDGPQTGNTLTQELRITSPGGELIDYVAGFFYSRAETDRVFTRSNIACSASTLPTIGAGLIPCSTAPGASTLTFPQGTARFGSTFKNTALFGQATLNATDDLRFIAGLRYTIDQLDGFHIRTVAVPGASNPPFDQGVFNSIGPGFPNGNPAAANGIPFRQRVEDENLSGRAGIQYDLNDDVMAYGTYSRGYKGPALNIFFNLQANGTPPLESETSDAFEVGLKSTLLDGRLILNLAGYYAKYKNFQANNPDFVLGQRVTRFSNAGTISTRGFEADFLFRPVTDLTFSGGVAYTDAKVDRFRLPAGGNAADLVPNGTRLAYAPEWKASLNADYRIRTGGFADIELGVQSAYSSDQLSLFVGNPIARANGVIDDYTLVDLSIGVVDPDNRFRVTFQAKNVFDTSFAASIADGGPLSGGNTGTSSYRYIIPREADRYYGVTARIGF